MREVILVGILLMSDNKCGYFRTGITLADLYVVGTYPDVEPKLIIQLVSLLPLQVNYKYI